MTILTITLIYIFVDLQGFIVNKKFMKKMAVLKRFSRLYFYESHVMGIFDKILHGSAWLIAYHHELR